MNSIVFTKIALCLSLASAAILALAGCASRDMTLSNQGFEELSRGDNLEARIKLEEALAINPQNPYALLNLGVVYQRTGRPEKARLMYEKVIALQPEDKAETSNIQSFTGRSLAEIAEANLEILNRGASGTSPSVPEPVPTPVAVKPPEEPKAGVEGESPLQEGSPAAGRKKEESREAGREETVYRVRETQMLLEIAGRHDVYGDVLKWPTLFRLNLDKFQSPEEILGKPVGKGTRLRMVTPGQASKRAAVMGERLWVVNAASVRSPDRTVQPATALMKRGHQVYLVRFDLAGEEWIRLRVGFFPNILEAMAVCEEIRPLMGNSGEPCVSKIDAGEFERNAGY